MKCFSILSGFLLGLFFIASCASSSKLVSKGWKEVGRGNYKKAEKKFFKAIRKERNNDKAYEGLAFMEAQRRDYIKAEVYMEKAYSLRPTADRAYAYARFANKRGKQNKAMELLYQIPKLGNFDYYRGLAKKESDFSSLKGDGRFNRYLLGYRRLKIQPYYAYSSEDDGLLGGENDMFVVVENQNKILLTTEVIQDNNIARWSNDYVIFDYPLNSSISISLLDEDVVKHDNLLSVKGYFTPNDYTWQNRRNTTLKVKVSDTDSPPYTTGNMVPYELGIGGVAAAIGIGALAYASINNNQSSNTYSISGFTSCLKTTNNSTDLYILSIGTDVENRTTAMDNDALKITSQLREGCGNQKLFGNVYSRTLTGAQATKVNILKAFNTIKAKTNEDDIFLLFFSGHGGVDNGRFIFGAREGKITVDEIVTGIDADNCKTILWFDACHAGQVGNDFRNKVDDYIRNKKLPNVSILMSSSDNEFSYVDTANNMGFFAKAIVDGPRGYADAGDMNHIISLRELVDYIKKVLPQRTRNCQYCRDQQTPQILNEGKSFNTRLSNY